MKLDVSAKEFNGYSNEKKKRYIARLFINNSGAIPVNDEDQPLAIITAGLPGAGKTEFLDSLADDVGSAGLGSFVRIDLDEIVAVYPDYTPKDYYKFRSQGNLVVARTIDEARRGHYNMLIDGTFSGMSGASIAGIQQLLATGYRVRLVYVFDSAESAWSYTKKRKLETGREVLLGGFIEAGKSLLANLRAAQDLFQDNEAFDMNVVVQKELRDKDYYITTEKSDIDNILSMEYNMSILEEKGGEI